MPFLDWLKRQVMQLILMSHARRIIVLFQYTYDSLSVNRYLYELSVAFIEFE